MNMLDIYINVKFCIHPPMEFLYAMYVVAKENELNKVYEELNITPDREIKYIIDSMRSKLSRYLLGELKYFFEMSEAIGHILPSFIIHNPEIKDIGALIRLVESSDKTLIMYYLVKSVISENSLENTKELNWNEFMDDIDKMIELVKYTVVKNSDIKEKLIECLENPEEAKQRYCLVLKGFYEKAYKGVEQKILNKLAVLKKEYEDSFKENPEEFFKGYFKSNVDCCYIHISLFKHTGWFTYSCENEEFLDWIVLGAYSDKIFGKAAIKERVNKFFKLLSDKKRIKIIDLLADRPWYGYELAEQLKLTPATVSYHIGFLIELDMVTFERDESRLYYSLNKEKVEELFEQSKKLLLHI